MGILQNERNWSERIIYSQSDRIHEIKKWYTMILLTIIIKKKTRLAAFNTVKLIFIKEISDIIINFFTVAQWFSKARIIFLQ